MYQHYKYVSDPVSGVVVGEITYIDTPLKGKRFTFTIKRDYIAEGRTTKQTNFFLRTHLASIRRVLDEVERELEAAEAEAAVAQRKALEEARNAQ